MNDAASGLEARLQNRFECAPENACSGWVARSAHDAPAHTRAWKPLRVSVVGYDAAASVKLVLASGVQAQALVGDSWTFSGQPLAIGRGSIFAV